VGARGQRHPPSDRVRNGAIRCIDLREDRGGDVWIFPDLEREADVLEILHERGLPAGNAVPSATHEKAMP